MTNEDLVAQLKSDGSLTDPSVEAAFLAVPRGDFLPGVAAEVAYADTPVPIKRIDGVVVSGASAPHMVAIMLERLALEPGHRVLEIGASTGYNAALMAEIVGPGGSVHTLDVDEDIVARARAAVARWPNVSVVCRDGWLGFEDEAPFDRIVLTVGSWDVAPAWREQLVPGGLLVAPIWLGGTEVLAALRRSGDRLESGPVSPCMFQRMRGLGAGPEQFALLHDASKTAVMRGDAQGVTTEALWNLLTGDGETRALDVELSDADSNGFELWLSLRCPGFVRIITETVDAFPPAREWIYGIGAYRATCGLASTAGAAIFLRGGRLRVFGRGDEGDRLASELSEWHGAGRPRMSDYCVRVHPKGAAGVATDGARLEKPQSTVIVSRISPAC